MRVTVACAIAIGSAGAFAQVDPVPPDQPNRVIAPLPTPENAAVLERGCGDEAFRYESDLGRRIWALRSGTTGARFVHATKLAPAAIMEIVVDTGELGSVIGPINYYMFPGHAPAEMEKVAPISWSARHTAVPYFRLMANDGMAEIATFTFVGCGDPPEASLNADAAAAVNAMRKRLRDSAAQ